MFFPIHISAYSKLAEFRKHRLYKYAFSIVMVVLATIIQKLVSEWSAPSTFLFYFPAVIIATLYGDGNVAIFFSCILSQYYFVPPYGEIGISSPKTYVRLGVFILSAELVKKIIRIQTEEKLKAEAAVEMLQQREKDLEFEKSTREKFVSTLSHDLQTPLTTVKLNAQLMIRNYGEQDEKILHAMNKQIRNINRIESMIRNLLDANSLRAGVSIPLEFEKCNLNELIANAIDELTHIHGDRFKVECSQKIHGFWSSNSINRIIENLCTNAVKYGDEQGKIIISADILRDGVFIKVNNKGKPISIEDQPKLFETFTRTDEAIQSHKTGWGLGLALVKGLTEAHGGVVTLESNELHGTTFIIYLPMDSRR